MQFNNNQPIYLQISGFIGEKILKKEWETGDRVPSVRDLAVSLEVNPNTIVRTYEQLQQKGIIFNKRGIGYFISEEAFHIVLQDRKDIFMKEELPAFLKSMDLLGISFQDITPFFKTK